MTLLIEPAVAGAAIFSNLALMLSSVVALWVGIDKSNSETVCRVTYGMIHLPLTTDVYRKANEEELCHFRKQGLSYSAGLEKMNLMFQRF